MQDLEINTDYFDAGVDMNVMDDWAPAGPSAVLDRLGPAHFRSKGFAFMGFLQTVYDQISAYDLTQPPAVQTIAAPTPAAIEAPVAAHSPAPGPAETAHANSSSEQADQPPSDELSSTA